MSWYPPRPKRRPGSGQWRAAGKRPFGTTWWGKTWVDALEKQARLDPNRLPRGRTYARTGAVGDLEVVPGQILAAVQGSRAKPYRVKVRVRTFGDDEWDRTSAALASQVGHLAALLDGELPPGVVDDLKGAGLEILPVAGEVQPRCSCPDWADPCKHSAAVCYLFADMLDADPFQLFLLRGRDRESLLAGLRARRAEAMGASTTQVSAGTGESSGASSAPDPGIGAREVWQRWMSRDTRAETMVPSVPMPGPRSGRPTVLGADPPPESAVSAAALRLLAADASERAHALAQGGRETGLGLSEAEDLARRAARLIDTGDLAEMATTASLQGRELFRRALAWRDGGREGLRVLSDDWDPPAELLAVGRARLGAGARARRNRVSLADRQLRLGRDGRWYPYRRSGRSGATWEPDGPSFEA
ncbi:MAG: SWIM zinc finger family protein [Acidimicrobiales bacterium]